MASYYPKDDGPEPSPAAPYYYGEPSPGSYPADSAPMGAMPPPGAYRPPTSAYQPAPPAVDDNIRVGEWEAELRGCTTHAVPNCLIPMFCPCVSLGQISQRLGIISFAATVSIFALVALTQWVTSLVVIIRLYYVWWLSDWYESYQFTTPYTLLCLLLACADAAVFLAAWHLRTQTHIRFELPGSCCCDFWASLCCTCCSISQMATHVKSYTPNSCGFSPSDTLVAYQRQGPTPIIVSHPNPPHYPQTAPSDHRSIDVHPQRYNTVDCAVKRIEAARQ